MLVLISRSPTPDVPYWRGRRFLAVLDALAWPAILLIAIRTAPFGTGIVGLVVPSLALLVAARRLLRAVAWNHRYRFTTLRWGTPLVVLLAAGAGMKLMS